MVNLATIAFDADDTLWHNERFFKLTEERFAELLRDHTDAKGLPKRLYEAEKRNLGHYGFGVKGFVLSMIETALDVTDHKVPGEVIRELIDVGRDMLAHPIELLPHAQETVEALAGRHRILLITKGDLLHQERKLAQSGLGDFFDAVEIVSDKTPDVYARIFAGHDGGAEGAMMVGNSMKSDVRPAIEAGSHGVFVPHDLAWDFEHADAPEHPKYHEIADLGALPDLIKAIG
ncbi:MAG: HAD family hydrolase [Pseudomonadota bacterium]|nr:HAD family hydrolase [Pseudomonadota bacterium]